jgi:hypothetical protein
VTVGSGHPRTESDLGCTTFDSFTGEACHTGQARVTRNAGALCAQARPTDAGSTLGAYDAFPALVSERRGLSGLSFPSLLSNSWCATGEGGLQWSGNASSHRPQDISEGNNNSTALDTGIGLGLNLKLSNAATADTADSSLTATTASFGCTDARGTPTSLLPGSRSQDESSSTLRRALDFRHLKEEPGLAAPALSGTWKTARSSPPMADASGLAPSFEPNGDQADQRE